MMALASLHDVGGSGVVLRVRQAGGIAVLGVGHAQFLRVLVHEVGKGRLAARHVLGKSHAGVVARLDDHPLQQHGHGHPVAQVNERAGAARAPGRLADHHLVLEADPLVLDAAEDGVGRHQLGDAGRVELLVLVPARQGPAAVVIHQHVGAGGQCRRRRDLVRIGGVGGAGQNRAAWRQQNRLTAVESFCKTPASIGRSAFRRDQMPVAPEGAPTVLDALATPSPAGDWRSRGPPSAQPGRRTPPNPRGARSAPGTTPDSPRHRNG